MNVNNNSITIEFLKMTLSFSDVILVRYLSSLPYVCFFFLIYDFTRLELMRWGNEKSQILLKKSKIWRGILWDFLRNSIWFGSFIHEKSQKFLCRAEDINLLSWIKMRFMETFAFFSFYSFFAFCTSTFYWNTFLSFWVFLCTKVINYQWLCWFNTLFTSTFSYL